MTPISRTIAAFLAALLLAASIGCGGEAVPSTEEETSGETSPEAPAGEPCDLLECIENQICIEDSTRAIGARCGCPDGQDLRGFRCADPAVCDDDYCASNGTCAFRNDEPYCACDTGYVGTYCEGCVDGWSRSGTECVKGAESGPTSEVPACNLECEEGYHCGVVRGIKRCVKDRKDEERVYECGPGYRLVLGRCVPD